MKLSIILDLNKNSKNYEFFVKKLGEHIKKITKDYEILFINTNLRDKLTKARGEFIITLDKSIQKDFPCISKLWKNKNNADIVILSEFNNFSRFSKNFWINKISSSLLYLPIKDVHNKIRIYNSNIFKDIKLDDKSNLLLQILVKAYFEGYKIKEINYKINKNYKINISNYLTSLKELRKIRKSVNSADYDDRAFSSKFPLQRIWHRKRYKIIMGFLKDKKNILDLGCGGSRIIQDLDKAIGFDLAINKLRFVRQKNKNQLLIKGDATKLPFKDSSFKTVICSELIEHIKDGYILINEIHRVLKKDGILILGTPDYNKLSWNIIEKLHNILFKDLSEVHISKYTLKSLIHLLEEKNFKVIDYKYILNSELIIKAKKIK